MYIIIRGPAGVGKTTLAKKLIAYFNSHKISAKYFSPGLMRKKHNLGFSMKEKLKADNFLISEARDIIEKGHVAIFDEVYYYPQQMLNFRNKLGSPIVIHLKAPIGALLERNSKRTGKKKLSEKRMRDVYGLDRRFRNGNVINTHKRNKNQVFRGVVRVIKARGLKI